MKIEVFPNPDAANEAAADCLADWLTKSDTRNLMVAAGNTPLDLYRRIAERSLPLSHLNVFALDEYVGVPLDEPRNCANLLRRTVANAWKIAPSKFFTVSSLEVEALASVREHERLIADAGGLDVMVLGLGQNGHLGFNEPGSARDSVGRLIALETSSIEANRQWFNGDYAPSKGITVGLKTILAARHVMILAYGSHKQNAVQTMIGGPVTEQCPASFLMAHPDGRAFLDRASAAGLAPDVRR